MLTSSVAGGTELWSGANTSKPTNAGLPNKPAFLTSHQNGVLSCNYLPTTAVSPWYQIVSLLTTRHFNKSLVPLSDTQGSEHSLARLFI